MSALSMPANDPLPTRVTGASLFGLGTREVSRAKRRQIQMMELEDT